MDVVNKPDENDKITNFLDPDAKKNIWTKVTKLAKPQGRKWHFTLVLLLFNILDPLNITKMDRTINGLTFNDSCTSFRLSARVLHRNTGADAEVGLDIIGLADAAVLQYS
ncbi:hypothetical protein Hanom_Chr03g00276821 [Helianthus anomalus]